LIDIPGFIGAGDFVYRSPDVPRFTAAAGSSLEDADGRRYLDAEAANGTVCLGYDSSILEAAMRRAAALPALPSFCESELRLDVARRLEAEVSRAVGAPGRISFEVGGAQGIELAMKIVASNRPWGTVATLQGGYHGRSPFTGALSASARYRRPIPVGAGEVVRLPYPDCEQCPFGLDPDGCEGACVAYLRSLDADRSGIGEEVAALVLEPLLNVGGMAMPPRGYLDAAVERFRAAGALIVVDEIFTGFHRTGPRFGFERHGLAPDIVVLSKALTNGAAGLSAVWSREPLAAAASFPPGTHSSTFSGTPLMLAVAGVVLERFADRAAWDARAARLEARLTEIVVAAAREAPALVRSTQVYGGVARLLLSRPAAWQVRAAALRPDDGDRPGVILASTGMTPDVIALHPPLTIADADLDAIGEGLTQALRSVR
jgi:4-aminobutyrate aminotransferase-like enzyme